MDFEPIHTYRDDYIERCGEEMVGDYFHFAKLTTSSFLSAYEGWHDLFSDYTIFESQPGTADRDDYSEILNWCRETCTSDWNTFNGDWWAFSDAKDATIFKMRWL
jgi:hypothetical protein